jgi:hypothetical protein
MSNNPESPLVSILEDPHLEPLVAADFEAADMARLAAAHPRRLAGIYSPRVRPAREEALRQAFHRGLDEALRVGPLLYNGIPDAPAEARGPEDPYWPVGADGFHSDDTQSLRLPLGDGQTRLAFKRVEGVSGWPDMEWFVFTDLERDEDGVPVIPVISVRVEFIDNTGPPGSEHFWMFVKFPDFKLYGAIGDDAMTAFGDQAEQMQRRLLEWYGDYFNDPVTETDVCIDQHHRPQDNPWFMMFYL